MAWPNRKIRNCCILHILLNTGNMKTFRSFCTIVLKVQAWFPKRDSPKV